MIKESCNLIGKHCIFALFEFVCIKLGRKLCCFPKNQLTFHSEQFLIQPSGSYLPKVPLATLDRFGGGWAYLSLSNQKCQSRMLPFLGNQLHAKNLRYRLISSSDSDDQRILQFEYAKSFCPITWEPEFSQIYSNFIRLQNQQYFHFTSISAKASVTILQKSSKIQFLGYF